MMHEFNSVSIFFSANKIIKWSQTRKKLKINERFIITQRFTPKVDLMLKNHVKKQRIIYKTSTSNI